VEGSLGSDVARERVVIETRQYAKRQRTWFRHQLKDENVLRLGAQRSGWQEQVERWIAQVDGEASMNSLEGEGQRAR
jgi:tRNA dimethylallyltransferase